MSNARFSKINVGKANKRGRFDLSHSVSTSANFGGTQPLFCKLMMPNSSIKGSLSGSVRCMPMPLPPFGKCGLHMYGQFVSMGSLLRNFGNFVAQTPYTTTHKSYVPQSLPKLPVYGPVSIFSLLLTPKFSFWCPFEVTIKETSGNPSWGSGSRTGNYATFDFGQGNDITDISDLSELVVPRSSASTAAINSALGFTVANNVSQSFLNGLSDLNRLIYSTDRTESNYSDFEDFFNQGFSLTNADYFLSLDSGSVAGYGSSMLIPVWLTQEGRTFVKILNGLGIQVNPSDSSEVNIMPLFAYYKAWFDIFAPKRDISWQQTQAFRLLDWYAEYGLNFSDIGLNTDVAEQGISLSNLCEFFYDLTQTYMTCDPNYFTSAVLSANSQDSGNGGMVTPYFDSPELINDAADSDSGVNSGASSHAGSGALSHVGIELINKLARYINTNNVIGRNIDAFFKAHFDGYSGVSDTSSFAGSSVLDIELGDVVVTADTDIADAGEFAGVGYGRGDFKLRYSTKEFGYYIVIGGIKPTTNYLQGTDYDNYITKPLELPTPELDALGWDKVRIAELFGTQQKSNALSHVLFGQNAFGYQPRYTGHKIHNSRLNGDFRWNGTRDNYLGMNLGNYITDVPKVVSDGASMSNLCIVSPSPSVFQASPLWRYTGMDESISNFNRIFKYSGGYVGGFENKLPFASAAGESAETWERNGTSPQFDNFVCYFEVDCKYNAPLANISASYFTLEGSDNYVDHE